MQAKLSKLQERLAQKTASIERRPAEGLRDHPIIGSSMTMPGQLGAFRLEAQRYQDTINSLTERVKQAEAASITSASKISLAMIDDSPYQPRMQYDPIEIDNLAHSLAAAGQEDPITIREKTDGRYELIGGHRRVRAARSLGWIEITANIVTRSDRDAELATMVQNEARIDLTDYERGKLYQRALAAGFASTQTEIANLFGTTQGHVSKRMAMLKLPSNYIAMLEEKPALFGVRCAESIAQLLKEFPSETALIEDGVRRISEEGADQNSVRQWVRQMVRHKYHAAPENEHAVVTDRSGRAMFTAKCSGRELTIRIKATEVETKEIEELVLAMLRQRAETNNE